MGQMDQNESEWNEWKEMNEMGHSEWFDRMEMVDGLGLELWVVNE